MNRYSYALLGSILSISSARLYVGFGGSLNFSILGHELHYFYYGISLLVLFAILRLKRIDVPGLISFLIGGGLGFISDEANLLLSI